MTKYFDDFCEYCGGDTSGVDGDYLVNTDHLSCVLKMNV